LQIRAAITTIQAKLNPKHAATKTASSAVSLNIVLDVETAQVGPNRSAKPQQTDTPKAIQSRNLDLSFFLPLLSNSDKVFTEITYFFVRKTS
jgi:hypothetical protein